MFKRNAYSAAGALILSIVVSVPLVAQPREGGPPNLRQKIVKFIKFITQPLDIGISPPHP
ncbi:MAG TPA: hypothetical protein VK504_08210 [Vicinamibacterales bacterium]|nr:hypothetical protein [Vicinamibacterales bacterium]